MKRSGPQPEQEITEQIGHGADAVPEALRRKKPAALPEVHQMRVNRHFLRLTQEVLGADITPDLSQGTCTMKYSPKVQEHMAAHAVGALAYYDQANVNGIMGITRAREVGFDLIHYNLHKTFSSPHGGMGPGCGALSVREFLKPYLPVPRVVRAGESYTLDYDAPESIGKIRSFIGNFPVVFRAYMWLMQMGAEGVREAAICSVLNNQYLMKKVSQIRGVKIYYAPGKRRIEQCRYSWEHLKQDTGFGTVDVTKRLVDFGMQHYWQSHHPHVVPEPFTLEPTESYSKDDLDEYVTILKEISRECYEEPEIIRTAPHNAPIHDILVDEVNDYDQIAVTYRQLKKRLERGTIQL